MKFFIAFMILVCVVFPGFSQSAASDRFQALSDSMDRTINSSNSKLESYDEFSSDSSNTNTFMRYNRRHEVLREALGDSESRLDLLIRTNDRPSLIKEERDNYENLLNNLKSLKSDYDSWLRSVQ